MTEAGDTCGIITTAAAEAEKVDDDDDDDDGDDETEDVDVISSVIVSLNEVEPGAGADVGSVFICKSLLILSVNNLTSSWFLV